MSMPQQLPRVPILPTRHPDLRKIILQQQVQNVLCVLAIRLLLAHPPSSNLSGVPRPQLKAQFRQQSLKPASVAAGFHAYSYGDTAFRQVTIELLRFLWMSQASFLELARRRIHVCDLLKLGVEICSYNDHRSAPFSRACWLDSAPPTLPGCRSRHCHGINYTNYLAAFSALSQSTLTRMKASPTRHECVRCVTVTAACYCSLRKEPPQTPRAVARGALLK